MGVIMPCGPRNIEGCTNAGAKYTTPIKEPLQAVLGVSFDMSLNEFIILHAIAHTKTRSLRHVPEMTNTDAFQAIGIEWKHAQDCVATCRVTRRTEPSTTMRPDCPPCELSVALKPKTSRWSSQLDGSCTLVCRILEVSNSSSFLFLVHALGGPTCRRNERVAQ